MPCWVYGGEEETPEGTEGEVQAAPAGANQYVYGPDEIDPETRLPKECANMTMMPYGEKGSDTQALYNAIPFAGSVFRKGGPVKYVVCTKNWLGDATLEYEVRDPATGGVRKLYAKPNKNFSPYAADYTWSMDLGDGKQGTVDVPNVRRLILNSFKGADWGIPYDPANPETGADDAAQLNLYTKQLGI